MNSIHDQGHKRTSINELLNPVGSAPSSHLESHPAYASNQHPGLSPSAYLPPAHQQHVSSSSYPSSMHSANSSFSLRAASWEATSEHTMQSRRQEVDTAASCRYGPAPVNPHPVYSEQYPRTARSVDEASNYGMDVSAWSTGSHDSSNVAYGQIMMSPIYSDERSNMQSDHMPKNVPRPERAPRFEAHPALGYIPQQYDQDAIPAYPPNGYYPVMLTNPAFLQYSERASVRIAARGTMPQALLPQPHHRGQAFYPAPMAFAAIPFLQPQQLPPQKRPLEPADEDSAAPKAKKSRAKAKTTDSNTTTTSRRGYNAKKRSEAAQIAAQNALVPMVSFTQPSNDKGKDKAPEGAHQATQRPEGGHQLHPELQFARCMSNRYRSEEFPRCVSCTRRWAGDTCRFQGIRFFLKDEKRNIVGISFVESQKPDGPSMHFPLQWDVALKDSHIRRVKRTVAQALLPVLKLEKLHIGKPEVIRRPRESEVRATCDTCMTSIFSCSWMCRLCGREACAECFEQVSELTTDRVGADEAEIAALQARREKHAHINPFFLSCTRRNEHKAQDFSPMSRFSKDELQQAITDMEALLAGPDEDALPIETEGDAPSDEVIPAEAPNGHIVDQSSSSTNGTEAFASDTNGATTSSAPPDPSTFASAVTTSLSQPSVGTIPSLKTKYFTDAELTHDVFRRFWVKGEPLVVTGAMEKFQVQWTPDYFMSKYGTQSCLILECQTDTNKRVTVGEFFSWFGKYEGRRDCWKLKDWPPSTDFKTAFPELYEDFSQATPVPNYVRRDGVLNIASHFPSNTVAPDLGPKMYNAMASFESQGSKGSTRLHMDMADAINIMLYAAPTPDGRPGSAVWDLFKAEDSTKLRKFLRKKFKGTYQHDPIHSQQFYLDSHLRKELFDDFGVKSYRIYQKPGEAVFIPAGCAHQVCNLADCIKVASDFVSPENIERCENLTREFREQNQSMAWKEDVLQLRTMMWFAWLSCGRQEKEMQN